jgi:hypothetical protein
MDENGILREVKTPPFINPNSNWPSITLDEHGYPNRIGDMYDPEQIKEFLLQHEDFVPSSITNPQF